MANARRWTGCNLGVDGLSAWERIARLDQTPVVAWTSLSILLDWSSVLERSDVSQEALE